MHRRFLIAVIVLTAGFATAVAQSSATVLDGVYTPVVTPFDPQGEIDFETLTRVIEFQLQNGARGIVSCGTTGESATLSRDERKAVTAQVVRTANGRVPVIAGAGGNHTARAVFWARDAAAAKADGILSVTPMYNKPSPEGLVRHFSAIAEATDLPMLVYNVPHSRKVLVEDRSHALYGVVHELLVFGVRKGFVPTELAFPEILTVAGSVVKNDLADIPFVVAAPLCVAVIQ